MAGTIALPTLVQRIVLDPSGVTGGIKQLGRATTQATAATTAMSQGFSRVARSTGVDTSQLVTASNNVRRFGLATFGIGALATKAFADYEASLAKTQALVLGSTDSINNYTDAITRIGEATARGPQELADALFFVTSAGLRGQRAIEALEIAARGSTIGLGETKVVADALTSALNAYGEAELNAAQGGDILTAAVRAGKVEANQLAPALGKAIPVASALGVSFADVNAAIAGMTRTGTDARTASIQLRQILQTLADPSRQTENALRSLGTSAEELRDIAANEGLIEALIEMRTITRGNEEAFADLFPNIRALAGALDLTGANLESNLQVFEDIRNSAGVLDEAFEVRTDTTQFRLAQSLEKLQQAIIDIGAAVAPVFEGISKAASVFATAVSQIPAPILQFASAMGVGVLAVGVFGGIIGKSRQVVIGFTQALTAKTVAVGRDTAASYMSAAAEAADTAATQANTAATNANTVAQTANAAASRGAAGAAGAAAAASGLSSASAAGAAAGNTFRKLGSGVRGLGSLFTRLTPQGVAATAAITALSVGVLLLSKRSNNSLKPLRLLNESLETGTTLAGNAIPTIQQLTAAVRDYNQTVSDGESANFRDQIQQDLENIVTDDFKDQINEAVDLSSAESTAAQGIDRLKVLFLDAFSTLAPALARGVDFSDPAAVAVLQDQLDILASELNASGFNLDAVGLNPKELLNEFANEILQGQGDRETALANAFGEGPEILARRLALLAGDLTRVELTNSATLTNQRRQVELLASEFDGLQRRISEITGLDIEIKNAEDLEEFITALNNREFESFGIEVGVNVDADVLAEALKEAEDLYFSLGEGLEGTNENLIDSLKRELGSVPQQLAAAFDPFALEVFAASLSEVLAELDNIDPSGRLSTATQVVINEAINQTRGLGFLAEDLNVTTEAFLGLLVASERLDEGQLLEFQAAMGDAFATREVRRIRVTERALNILRQTVADLNVEDKIVDFIDLADAVERTGGAADEFKTRFDNIFGPELGVREAERNLSKGFDDLREALKEGGIELEEAADDFLGDVGDLIAAEIADGADPSEAIRRITGFAIEELRALETAGDVDGVVQGLIDRIGDPRVREIPVGGLQGAVVDPIVTELLSGFEGANPEFEEIGEENLNRYLRGWLNNGEEEVDEVTRQLISNLRANLDDQEFSLLLSSAQPQFADDLSLVRRALSETPAEFERVLRNALQQTLTADAIVAEFQRDLDAIGQGLFDGIAAGVSLSDSSAISNPIKVLIDGALREVRDNYAIRSPSKVWAVEIGEPITLGIAKGILDAKSKVDDSAVRVIDDVFNKINSQQSAVADRIAAGFAVVDSEETIGELEDRFSKIGGLIAEKQKEIADLIASGAGEEISGKENLLILQAEEQLREAQRQLRLRGSVDDQLAVIEAEERLAEVKRNATEANGDLISAEQELEDLLAEQARLPRDIAEARLDLIQAGFDLIDAEKELQIQGEEAVRVFEDIARAVGLSEEAITGLKDSLTAEGGLFDDLVGPNVRQALENIDSLIGVEDEGPGPGGGGGETLSVDETLQKLRELKNIDPFTLIDLGSFARSNTNKLTRRRHGGPVKSLTPYMVGEGGPELFVPEVDGDIIPNGAFGGRTIINVYNPVPEPAGISVTKQLRSIVTNGQFG